jgi:hypothetical protein
MEGGLLIRQSLSCVYTLEQCITYIWGKWHSVRFRFSSCVAEDSVRVWCCITGQMVPSISKDCSPLFKVKESMKSNHTGVLHGLFDPTVLQRVGNYLPRDTGWDPRRLESKTLQIWQNKDIPWQEYHCTDFSVMKVLVDCLGQEPYHFIIHTWSICTCTASKTCRTAQRCSVWLTMQLHTAA